MDQRTSPIRIEAPRRVLRRSSGLLAGVSAIWVAMAMFGNASAWVPALGFAAAALANVVVAARAFVAVEGTRLLWNNGGRTHSVDLGEIVAIESPRAGGNAKVRVHRRHRILLTAIARAFFEGPEATSADTARLRAAAGLER